MLGWSVGVLLLGALTLLLAFYSESARLESGTLIHIAKLGSLNILVDYDLAKMSNVRLEPPAPGDPDMVQVRFDYDGGSNALGNAMPCRDGQRIVDAITDAGRFVPRALEPPQQEVRTVLLALKTLLDLRAHRREHALIRAVPRHRSG